MSTSFGDLALSMAFFKSSVETALGMKLVIGVPCCVGFYPYIHNCSDLLNLHHPSEGYILSRVTLHGVVDAWPDF